jgi:hypothetical protein
MSTWLSPETRLLRNMCSKTESQSKKNLLLTGKMGRRVETRTIFCQDNTRDANRRPTRKFESKGESIVEYKLGMTTID